MKRLFKLNSALLLSAFVTVCGSGTSSDSYASSTPSDDAVMVSEQWDIQSVKLGGGAHPDFYYRIANFEHFTLDGSWDHLGPNLKGINAKKSRPLLAEEQQDIVRLLHDLEASPEQPSTCGLIQDGLIDHILLSYRNELGEDKTKKIVSEANASHLCGIFVTKASYDAVAHYFEELLPEPPAESFTRKW